jgi:hypothetical protein
MSGESSERWVVISAILVAGIYAYRRLTEAATSPVSLKTLIGAGSPVALGAFVTAWGFTFLIVSIMQTAAPGLGAAFAVLIATGDLLTNGPQIFSDVLTHEKSGTGTTASTRTASAAPAVTPTATPVSSTGGAAVGDVIGGVL